MELCLFGAASGAVDEIYFRQTELLGQCLAARGHMLIFGGGATGVMGAAVRGVSRAGGRVTGVAPRFFDEPGVLSPLCDELILTETMDERKTLMEARADGFIIAPGGIGTLDEFFEVLTLRTLERHGKPIALFNVQGYYDDLLAFLRTMHARRFVDASLWDCMGVFAEPETLLDYLELSSLTIPPRRDG